MHTSLYACTAQQARHLSWRHRLASPAAAGHDLLQPSTALLAAAFLYLTRNVVRSMMRSYRTHQAAAEARRRTGSGARS